MPVSVLTSEVMRAPLYVPLCIFCLAGCPTGTLEDQADCTNDDQCCTRNCDTNFDPFVCKCAERQHACRGKLAVHADGLCWLRGLLHVHALAELQACL